MASAGFWVSEAGDGFLRRVGSGFFRGIGGRSALVNGGPPSRRRCQGAGAEFGFLQGQVVLFADEGQKMFCFVRPIVLLRGLV